MNRCWLSNGLIFFILILATFRLTHLIVFDEITSFIRKPFLTATIQENAYWTTGGNH
ncbi:DUF1360 domain-containing protein [Peribacillus frigoritolerans]|nr:DUF1360 domain-containing protein [Peribacillus frigoritolerans]